MTGWLTRQGVARELTNELIAFKGELSDAQRAALEREQLQELILRLRTDNARLVQVMLHNGVANLQVRSHTAALPRPLRLCAPAPVAWESRAPQLRGPSRPHEPGRSIEQSKNSSGVC